MIGESPTIERFRRYGATVDPELRRHLATDALRGYVSGPDAVVQATEIALERAFDARALILVEGISDQIAVETLARRLDRVLSDEGVVVLPIGGAHAITRFLGTFGPDGLDLQLAGLCDRAEADSYLRGLDAAGMGPVADLDAMARLGFHICTEDLEDELVRALGQGQVEALLESQGDLGSFRTLQRQPQWRDAEFDAQIRRFFGAGARRKSRYARRMVEALDLDNLPKPLVSVLAAISDDRR